MTGFPSAELLDEVDRLLDFGARAALPQGGYGWLDSHGVPTATEPRHLYVTCRMTHVFALASLSGRTDAPAFVDHGLEALTTLFQDEAHGGWFHGVALDSPDPVSPQKNGYSTVFVILAASSASMAGRPVAANLLHDALGIFDRHFWEPEAGLMTDEWTRDFTTASAYRGANGVMHGVEALMAAADATGDPEWSSRAQLMAARMMARAEEFGWRLPEHYDASWRPDLEHNRDNPSDPFKPYGATPGHGFEWSRLLLQLDAQTGNQAQTPIAEKLFATAVEDSWMVDGSAGLVYTTDFAGRPLIRQRMHWVLCEAIAAAAALHRRTRKAEYLQWHEQFWTHAQAHHIDRELGSWHHELTPDHQPAATIRPGKADIYHAVQACLVPLVPLRGSLAAALQHQPPQRA